MQTNYKVNHISMIKCWVSKAKADTLYLSKSKVQHKEGLSNYAKLNRLKTTLYEKIKNSQ